MVMSPLCQTRAHAKFPPCSLSTARPHLPFLRSIAPKARDKPPLPTSASEQNLCSPLSHSPIHPVSSSYIRPQTRFAPFPSFRATPPSSLRTPVVAPPTSPVDRSARSSSLTTFSTVSSPTSP